MGQSIQLVEKFLKTLEARDLDGVAALVTDDVVYANPPSEPLVGRTAMVDFLSFNYKRMDRSSCVMHAMAQTNDGRFVMNERTEHMHFGDQKAGATFMGIFEITEGKISAWRDYWDHASFQQQMVAIGQKAGPGIGEAKG